MKCDALALAAGLSGAGLVGSAVAAVPDQSPFTWPSSLAVAAKVELPDAPPPPGAGTTRVAAGADIVLATPPRVSVSCPARAMRLPRATSATSGGQAASSNGESSLVDRRVRL